MQEGFQFEVGYHEHLHPEPSINFQMNRWISYLGRDALVDMQAIAPRLTDFSSYLREFLALSERAFAEGRDLHGAYYLRSAEFFMRQDDPRKAPARERFVQTMREQFGVAAGDCHAIPYRDGRGIGKLPAYAFFHPQPRATLVIHGGFDSYIEEFFPVIMALKKLGYTVICFEGPGQGGALHEGHLCLTQEWHKPVQVVLDYFEQTEVTLIGISMGGCLALRAAAFEPRVKRVVAYDVFYDWVETTFSKLKPIAPLLRFLLRVRAERLFNRAQAEIMKQSPLFDWAMRQAMLVLGADSSYEVFRASKRYTTRDISHLVTQDCLLMAGAEDHIIPLSHLHRQGALLKNPRSLTTRIFTRAEQAQNHCQVGNLGLALTTIVAWLEQKRL